MEKSEKEKLSLTSDMEVDTDNKNFLMFSSSSREKSNQAVTGLSLAVAKQEKRKLSLTSDTDVDTHKQLVTDDRRCLQRDMEETDSENRITGESTSNCIFPGTCEAEVSYEGGECRKGLFDNCKNNPGHLNFVPVDQFSKEHLPPDYRNTDLFDLIRALSELTVRVLVKYASDRRPKTWPGTDKPYPFCEDIYRTFSRTGTGRVFRVEKAPSHMQCSTCKNYPSPNDNHSLFYIVTAAHIVYDEQETQKTTCHLFFDKGDEVEHCPGVVAITNLSFNDDQVGIKEDFIAMCYVTCDPNVIDRLKKNLELFESLNKTVRKQFLHNVSEEYGVLLYSASYGRNPLCVIVSHPHGCSKRVSVGYCSSRSPSDKDIMVTRLTYNTPTCPGSSGAFILLLDGMDTETHHLHSAKLGIEGNKEINHSSWSIDEFYSIDVYTHLRNSTHEECRLCSGNTVAIPTLKMLFVGDERKEPWDVEVSYNGEEGLGQRYKTCEMNQGHVSLISIDQLNDGHLQASFISPECLDLIRVLSDLTVRVSVKSVSEKRPDDLKFLKTFSGDEQPDSCYRDSTRNMMLTGTGCVAKVIKYENSDEYRTCSCKECQMSQTPKTEFAYIYIRTTVQVVYDNFEAEHSTCDFFFDRGDTPDTCPGVVTLSGVSVEDCEIENLQYLICVTHDMGLADRMTEMITKYKSLPKIIVEKIPEDIIYCSMAFNMSYAIVVSHPHGCSKQVSFGQIHIPLDIYATRTCSGSAGAHFLMLRNFRFYYFVHIGKCKANRYCNHGKFLEKSR